MIDKDRWTPPLIGWAAGLLEGEGSFILRKGQRPEVRCAMTDEDVVRRLGRVLGCGGVYGPFEKYFNGARVKDQWVFSCQSQRDSVDLMLELRPWMGSRRQAQIDACLAGWRDYQRVKHAHTQGHRNNNSKLTPDQVAEIRAEYDGIRFKKGQQEALACKFGVSTNTIYAASRGNTYA